MAVSAFATIRAAIAKDLQDSTYTYWTEDEIDAWINEAQRDYAFHSKCLKAQTVISAKENIETYNFPDDYLEFIRMEDESGNDIVATSWKALLEEYGNNYRATTGTPEAIYADLDGEGQFRFYPRPSTAIDSAPTAFTPYIMQEINWTGGTVYGMCSYGTRFYVCDETYIYIYEGEISAPNLVKQIAHGITITGLVYIVIADPLDKTYITAPTIICGHGTKLYKTNILTGTTTEYGTSAGTIIGIAEPYNVADAQYLVYWSEVAGVDNLYYTATGSFSEIMLSAAVLYISQSVLRDNIIIARSGATGILTITYDLTSGLPTTATPTISGCAIERGIVKDPKGTSIWLTNTLGGLTNYDTQLAFTGNGILKSQTVLFHDGNYIFGCDQTLPGTVIRRIDSTGASITILTGIPVAAPLYFSCLGASLNGEWYRTVHPTDPAFYARIYTWDDDLGDIIYYGGTVFNSEVGGFIDLQDTANVIVFESDEGAVTTVYESATAYPLWYVRYPREDELEITNTKALKYYVMWKAYLRDGDTQNMPKANLNYQLYQDQLGDAFQTRSKGYLSGNQTRPKVNFY